MIIVRYPWLKNVTRRWPMIVRFYQEYIIDYKVVRWNGPNANVYKCNFDDAFRNSGTTVCAYCVINQTGELNYTEVENFGVVSSIKSETVA